MLGSFTDSSVEVFGDHPLEYPIEYLIGYFLDFPIDTRYPCQLRCKSLPAGGAAAHIATAISRSAGDGYSPCARPPYSG